MNFGNSVAESKLGAEAGHYLLFHIVQGANLSLIALEKFSYLECKCKKTIANLCLKSTQS